MKKRFIISSLMTLALTVSLAGFAEAKGKGYFDKKDTNKDGALSQDEFVNAKMKRFDRQDTNKDGTITKDEAKTNAQNKFNKLDTNKDGKVTKEEMKAHHGAKGKEAK